jgi:hypothetical protein
MIPLAVTTSPGATLPVFARLYGCSEADFAGTTAQMTAAWIAQDDQEVLGALGLRPSPAHGAEVMGGAFPGSAQHRAALALIEAALLVQPRLYAYAEDHLLPARLLEAAGLHPVSAYTRMSGALPAQLPSVPDGFKVVPLSEVGSLEDRLVAQQTYSDLIGHTPVTSEAVQPNAGGSDDTLGRLAYDAAGMPVGICRVWLEGDLAKIGSPGVRPDVRHSGLRQALLLSACTGARAAGATQLQMDAWGDSEAQRAEDQALGLVIDKLTPIYR